MPVFNKWNWTEASYKTAAVDQSEAQRTNLSTIQKHLRTPYASGVSNLAVTKFRAKLIRRTLSWLTAANRHV